ncbi:hypothetical protein LXL04_033679 [Taraxacum kok-saghyz]
MTGGARRRALSSDLRSPPSHPVQSEISDLGNEEVDNEKQKLEQEQQQSMNGGDEGGNEYDEEEDEEYQAEDQSVDVNFQGEEQADGDESKGDNERPKLAEGYYEIEAVRRKRKRKGETQYLVKWRDWPESSNTWEPVKNLKSCVDFIEAFEERWRSRSNRKRKRKNSAVPTPQPKKKQNQPPHQRSPDATYDVPSVKIKIIEDPSPIPSVNNSNFSTSNDSGSLIKSPQIQEPKIKNESENMTQFAIHIQEDPVGNGNGTGAIRVSPRIGARRRKSGAVRRFKQESNLVDQNDAAVKDDCALGDGLGISGKVPVVTKILKPVNYSTSVINDIEDVSVSFLVRRSDEEEVVVDNKYLKEHNPLLLINFYEQHLRYNSPSE